MRCVLRFRLFFDFLFLTFFLSVSLCVSPRVLSASPFGRPFASPSLRCTALTVATSSVMCMVLGAKYAADLSYK